MKKQIFSFLITLVLILPSFAQSQSNVTIDTAIENAAKAIAGVSEITKETPVAIAVISSPTSTSDQWLEQQMFNALQPKLRAKSVALRDLDRSKKIVNAERDYQYSGAVSDDQIVNWGNDIGAKYIVHGSLSQIAGGSIEFCYTLVNVETRGVPVTGIYKISYSSQVSKLLGPERELNTIEDYREVLIYLDDKMLALEKTMRDDLNSQKTAIEAGYQARIDAEAKRITEEDNGEHGRKALQGMIDVATNPIIAQRDAELKLLGDSCKAKFSYQISSIELNRETVVKKLQKTKFSLTEGVSARLKLNYDAVEDRNYYTASVLSNETVVYELPATKIDTSSSKTLWGALKNAEQSGSAAGLIEYTLRQKGGKDSPDFDVVITCIRVFDSSNKTTLFTKTDFSQNEAKGGTISLSAKSAGSVNVKAGYATSSYSSNTAGGANNTKNSTKTGYASGTIEQRKGYEKELTSAVINRDVKKIERLIKEGADINAYDEYGFTALITAATKGYDEIVDMLIKNGAEVDEKGESGYTAFIAAAGNDKKSTVDLLFHHGAYIYEKNSFGWTAQRLAELRNFKEIVMLIKDYKVKVNLFIEAAKKGNKRILEAMLDQGQVHIDARDEKGMTALIMAAKSNRYGSHDEVIAFLKERGASKLFIDNTGNTAGDYEAMNKAKGRW